jgi:hypothetical protein
MKKQYDVDPKHNIAESNKVDKAYRQLLEAFLINLLCRKPMSFQDIACHAEGAYPSDVLRTLQNLVLTNKVELHDKQYRVLGPKHKSSKKDIVELINTPPLSEQQLVLKPLNANSIFGDPHPSDYDWRYTAKARDELTKRLDPFIQSNSEIALLGAPTLFLSLYRLGLHLTLFDNSASVLADLKSSGITNGLVHHNIFKPLLEFRGNYDAIVADPPWYVPFHKAFILRSSELLKEQGLLLLSVPPWLTRPSAITDRAEIITFATKAGFDLSEIAPGVLSYQCPKFEQIALSMQGIHCGNWRQGDLFVFRKIKEAQSSLKVSHPKDEPTWDEYRFGLLKVKLRHRKQIDSGELKIKPVSKEGPYLGTVSRRSPLRHRIDLWTSDNIAYSITRLDIVKVALDRLQSGESPKAIVEDLGPRLSKTEVNKLLKLLTNITIPYEEDEFEQIRKPKSIASHGTTTECNSYVNKFIEDNLLPNISDAFWQERLTKLLFDGSSPNSVHLAIFVEPYLKFILEGRKTVESRFNSHRCAPYQKVQVGDILLLKRSGGPVVGLCEVANVWFYRLDPESWDTIKKEFAQDLCVQDPSFWEKRQHASYATLMRIQHVCPIAPAKFTKYDRRGWVLLTAKNVTGRMEFKDG